MIFDFEPGPSTLKGESFKSKDGDSQQNNLQANQGQSDNYQQVYVEPCFQSLALKHKVSNQIRVNMFGTNTFLTQVNDKKY